MLRDVIKVAKEKARAIAGDESGVTAIEYGLIAAAIAVAIIVAIFALGEDIADLFGEVSSEVQNAGTGG